LRRHKARRRQRRATIRVHLLAIAARCRAAAPRSCAEDEGRRCIGQADAAARHQPQRLLAEEDRRVHPAVPEIGHLRVHSQSISWRCAALRLPADLRPVDVAELAQQSGAAQRMQRSTRRLPKHAVRQPFAAA
jgi:hypothetical protein